MHEVLITRGQWMGLPLDLIMVRENCALVHPGGKNMGTCHGEAHTRAGREKLVRQLIQYEGEEKILAWLESLKGAARSLVVADAMRLVAEAPG